MNIKNILVLNQAFSKVIINLIDSEIVLFLTIGIALLVIGLFLSIKSKKIVSILELYGYDVTRVIN